MVRMDVHGDGVFCSFSTRWTCESAPSERQTLETAVTRSSVCLLDCELGRAAYVIGSHQLWQRSDSLLQTD